MNDAPANPALSKQQRVALVGLGLAVGLIFGGVLLHVIFPTRGEPLAPPPAVSYPPDVGPDEETGDSYYDEHGEPEGEDFPPGAEPL